MAIDRSDDDDAPLARDRADADSPPDRPERAAMRCEDRDRGTYYEQLRAADQGWDKAAARFSELWGEHQERWPAAERPAVSATDHPGAWRGAGHRELDAAASFEVDQGCERIRVTEQAILTPAMRQIEAADPGRSLTGLDHRLKAPDRLKEKVADYLWADTGATTQEALSMVPDAVRFTFCYLEERYASGVRSDIERLEARGFELAKDLKNSWESNEYRGINSQWRHPGTGQRFEVQFHTEVSFAAKQLTHAVYERARNPATTDAEREELNELQHGICAEVPVPPDATEIKHHPREERHG
jgi:hypothetical protein